jgi:hypothetical protein
VSELHEVRLAGFPLALHARAQEHHEELMREFQLLALSSPSAGVPQRLVALVEELTTSFGGFTSVPNAARDAAAERGEDTIDLTYQVPPSAAAAATRLDAMLDEADEYCRAGERLLTMAAPDDVAALRHWQLAEFAAQLGGAAPTPWAEWSARRALTTG